MKETHKLKDKTVNKYQRQFTESFIKLPALYQTQVSFDVQWEFSKVDSLRKLKNDLWKLF